MKKKKILIIDDDKDILEVTEKKLKTNDYIVATVSKATDACDTAKLFKPDLILSDIAMPDIDGYTLVSCMRKLKSLKDTPILFFTGHELESESITKRMSELNVSDFITKPFTFDDLLAKIKKIIG